MDPFSLCWANAIYSLKWKVQAATQPYFLALAGGLLAH